MPAGSFALAAIFLETIGAVCIMLGLFTRFFAALLTIGLGIVFVKVHLPNGFAVSDNGFEYVLLRESSCLPSYCAAAVPTRSIESSERNSRKSPKYALSARRGI